MRAAVFEGAGRPLSVTVVPDPTPSPGELVLRTRCCGICGTDLHMTSGAGMSYPAPCVLGHELSGEVVARGAGAQRHVIGDRVAVLPFWACGRCAACVAGRPNLCVPYEMVGIGRISGGFAEYTPVKDSCCLRLPDNLGYEHGALAEPLAVALRGVRKAHISVTSRVLILGAGPIGLAAAFWARRLGAGRLVVAAPSQRRAPLALRMGADGFVPLGPRAADDINDGLGGAPSIVIECVGERDQVTPTVGVMKELDVRFSMVYDVDDYATVLATLAAGAAEPLAMITDRVPLNAMPETFEALRGRTHQCKVLLDPWAETSL